MKLKPGPHSPVPKEVDRRELANRVVRAGHNRVRLHPLSDAERHTIVAALRGERSEYDRMLGHLWYHDVRGWLLKGCKKEDARTIKEAVERVSSRRLREGIARILIKGERLRDHE